MLFEIATVIAGMVALSAFERFLSRMRENMVLEGGSLFAGVVALSAFERILP